MPADCRALLAALAGCPVGDSTVPAEVQVAEAGAATVAALVQATTARLSRVADLAAELDGLRLAFSALTDVACSPGEANSRAGRLLCSCLPACLQRPAPQALQSSLALPSACRPPHLCRSPHRCFPFSVAVDGSLALYFVNLDAEVKFGVSLHLPASYPVGPMQQCAKIWFDGGWRSRSAAPGGALLLCIPRSLALPIPAWGASVSSGLSACCPPPTSICRRQPGDGAGHCSGGGGGARGARPPAGHLPGAEPAGTGGASSASHASRRRYLPFRLAEPSVWQHPRVELRRSGSLLGWRAERCAKRCCSLGFQPPD